MIYVLDENPELAARYLSNEELIRSIPLAAQFLAEAHVICDGYRRAEETLGDWQLPCHHWRFNDWGRWASERANFDWMQTFARNALVAYEQRFERRHGISHWAVFTRCPDGFQKIGRTVLPYSVDSSRRLFFETAKNPHWSAPSKMPEWFAVMVQESLKELVL